MSRSLRTPTSKPPPSATGRLAYRLAYESLAANAPAAAASRAERGELPLAPTARVLRRLSEKAVTEYSAKRIGGALEFAAFLIETFSILAAARRWLEYRLVGSNSRFLRALGQYHRLGPFR